jgi:hypothetical protein
MVISAADSQTLARISNHFLFADSPHNFNHFVHKV